MDLVTRKRRIEVRKRRIILDSSRSLEKFLGHIVIDCRPEPRRWCEIKEDWQYDLTKPIVPAIENICGIRSDYSGPRNFFYVLPRGHDKTGLIGRIATYAASFAKRPIICATAASTRQQARLLLESMEREIGENSWLSPNLEINRNVISGPGGKIEVLSSEAGSSSGRIDDIVILDELTFWENQDLFNVLYSGRAKRPQSVFIIITNAGLKGSWQYDLYNTAKHSERWHFHESPAKTMLASWMTEEDIEDIRSVITPGFARRVIDNEWIEATENPALEGRLEGNLISRKHLWRDLQIPRDRRTCDLYMGVDFGFTINKTVIWTDELTKDGRAVCRDFTMLDKCDPDEQIEQVNMRIVAWGNNLVKCSLDQGTQGWTIAKHFEKKYPTKCQGVQLTDSRQGQIVVDLQHRFDKMNRKVPNDNNVIRDLMTVECAETANGIPRVKTNRGPDGGHGDYFWAMGLSEFGMPTVVKKKATIVKAYSHTRNGRKR